MNYIDQDTTIKEARKECDLTRKEVFDILGIPERTLMNWENGISKCPKYLEVLVVEKLMRIKRRAVIKPLTRNNMEGFGCYLRGGELLWFLPGEINAFSYDMIKTITIMQQNGWEIEFDLLG